MQNFISAPSAAGCVLTLPIVLPHEAGLRLDQFLLQATQSAHLVASLPEGSVLSRQRLQDLIDQGYVCSNFTNPCTKKAYKVKVGEVFTLTLPAPVKMLAEAENIPLHIFYEDEDLIVVNKSAHMAMHPAPGSYTGTLVHALLHHCKGQLSGIGGVERPGIVHRLDKGTSGLVVAAKNDMAHTHLSAQFKNRSIERRYSAFCYGQPMPTEGFIEGNIGRHPQHRKKMAVLTTGGKAALTHYKVCHNYPYARISEVELKLHTGRTHQIRVHMAAKGCPLVGDPVYTPQRFEKALEAVAPALHTFIKTLNHQALHAYKLGFEHPRTGESLLFVSNLPPKLFELKEKIANASNNL